jgi:hypothetical protein
MTVAVALMRCPPVSNRDPVGYKNFAHSGAWNHSPASHRSSRRLRSRSNFSHTLHLTKLPPGFQHAFAEPRTRQGPGNSRTRDAVPVSTLQGNSPVVAD